MGEIHPDTIRLNWLEHMARNGGIFLYNGVDVKREKQTAVGLGLRPGRMDRNLREAIDAASPHNWSASCCSRGPIPMTDRDLAGCPFCGGEARLIERHGGGEKYDGYACKAACVASDITCPAAFTNLWDMTPEDAAKRWNRRPALLSRTPGGEDARPTIADLIDAKLAEGDKRDAARYRWLRDLPDGSPYECIGNMPGDRWDDEIDAAIEKD